MKNMTDFRKTVETAVDPRLESGAKGLTNATNRYD